MDYFLADVTVRKILKAFLIVINGTVVVGMAGEARQESTLSSKSRYGRRSVAGLKQKASRSSTEPGDAVSRWRVQGRLRAHMAF